MKFSGQEMAALLKVAKMMALADGKMTNDEKEIIKADLGSFGIELDTLQSVALEKAADNMEGAECIAILSGMSIDQKKYACGYLATVMAADGKFEQKEKELWGLVSLLAGFPTMNVADAISFWASQK
jgi:uncharacterized tellurite resistance protein B-like protein